MVMREMSPVWEDFWRASSLPVSASRGEYKDSLIC